MYTLQLSLDVNNFIDDWCSYNHTCTVDWYRAACATGCKQYGTYSYTFFMIEKATIKFAILVFAHYMWFTSINIFKLKCENFTKAIVQLFTIYTLQLSLDDNNFMDDWCRYIHTCTVDWYKAACTAGCKRYGTYCYTLFMTEKATIKFAIPVFAHCMWFTSITFSS